MKTYLYGDLEVALTGRYVDKHISNSKHRFVEVVSADVKMGWSMFVDINTIYEIQRRNVIIDYPEPNTVDLINV
jgi:hypothetical protein